MLLCGPEGGAAPDAACGSQPDAAFALALDGAITGAWAHAGQHRGAADGGVCSVGWVLNADSVCEPALRADCPTGSGPLPGGRCTSTGDADCPADDFADVSTEAGAARVVYVRAGADSVGADGTRAHAFATLSAGIAAAGAGGWVLIARGQYPESIDVAGQEMHLVGACAAGVQIQGGSTAPVVRARAGATLDARGFTTLGGSGGVVVDGARGRIRGVRITNPSGRGLYATSATLDGTDIAIEDVQCDASGRCRGLQVDGASRVTLTRISVLRAGGKGIYARDDSVLDLSDSLVRDSLGMTVPDPGDGLWVSLGAHATLTRVAIVHSLDSGVMVFDVGTTLALSDSFVEDSEGVGPNAAGPGVVAMSGSVVALSGSSVVRSQAAGVYATGPGTRIDAADSWIADVRPAAADRIAAGAVALDGAGVRLARSRIQRLPGSAIVASGPGTTVDAQDVALADLVPAGTGLFGRGVSIFLSAHGRLDRVLLERSAELGVFAGIDATVDMQDVIIRTVLPSRRGFGAGVGAFDGSAVHAERVAIVGANGSAWIAAQSTESTGTAGLITATDLYARSIRTSTIEFDSLGAPSGRAVAYGLHVVMGGSIDATRAVLDAGGYGFFASHGALGLHDAVIANQLDAEGAQDGATLVLERIGLVQNARDGVLDDSTLPSVASLPPPTAVCPDTGCR